MAHANQLLTCTECAGPLTDEGGCENGHRVVIADDGLWLLHAKDRADAYDDPAMSARYLQYAFGYLLKRSTIGRGSSEGLYRTVSDLCRDELGSGLVLDAGCGVGRTTYDLGRTHPDARVLAIDYSARMASTARAIAQGKQVMCGWPGDGWDPVGLELPPLGNVAVIQGDALRLALATKPMLIVANMLIDRLFAPEDVFALLAKWHRDLEPGGALVLSTPFNWVTKACWDRFNGGSSQLVEIVSQLGFRIEVAFEGVPYRESVDPVGTYLELPVTFLKARR